MKKKLRQVKVGESKTCIGCQFFNGYFCLRSFNKETDCPDFHYRLLTDEEYYELIKSEKRNTYRAAKIKTK